jgi:hypothetical protein
VWEAGRHVSRSEIVRPGGDNLPHQTRLGEVDGPIPGERLCHLTDGVLHRAKVHRPVAGGDASRAILQGTDEEDGDVVSGNVEQVEAQPGGGAEPLPNQAGSGCG